MFRELAEWVGPDGISRPYVPEAAINLQCTRSVLANAVAVLVKVGLIRRVRHAGNGRRAEYRFTALDDGEIPAVATPYDVNLQGP